MVNILTIGSAQALGDAWSSRPSTLTDPVVYADHLSKFLTAKHVMAPVMNELMSLMKERVSSANYARQFTCGAGDALGDPVRISGNNTVTKALADSTTNNKVIGFIRHKGNIGAASDAGALTCYLDHFRYVSGLTGGTAGAAIYLTNTGGFSATPGTVSTIVGMFLSVTEGLLTIVPIDFIRSIAAHAASHQNGGSDEINVAGLSGLLADGQTPLAHATSHKNGGSDEVATATPGANEIVKADANGKLADGWIPSTNITQHRIATEVFL